MFIWRRARVLHFGCVNLRSQQYCIFNEKYDRETYLKKIQEFNLAFFSEVKKIKKLCSDFWLKFPNKYMHGIQNLSSSGDYVFNSRYVKKSFIVTESEYCKYCAALISKNNRDCYDFSQFGENTERIYESLICGKNISNFIGCISCLEGRDIRYSLACSGSDLFGCIGLNKKKHCILNRQYTKEDYEMLVSKIIKHMSEMPYLDKKGRSYTYGDFFPTEISQYDYNETTAQEFFPLTKEEALKQGYSWKESKERNYKIDILPEDLPDNIKDVPDDIVSKILGCEHQGECKEQCTTAFKIIDRELSFYRSHNIPLPHLCPNCRHYERIQNRNPNKLWHRKCMKSGCQNEFETSFSPDRPEIVYCEDCYKQEVY